MTENNGHNADNFFEILAMALLYAEGVDPLGLEKVLRLNDKGKVRVMTRRFQNSPTRLISALKAKVQELASEVGESTTTTIEEPTVILASQKRITPSMSMGVDGVFVKEQDALYTSMPKKQSPLDSALLFTKIPVEEDHSLLSDKDNRELSVCYGEVAP